MHLSEQKIVGCLVLSILAILQAGCSEKLRYADGIEPVETTTKDTVLIQPVSKRNVLLLDGTWQVAQGSMDQVPEHFDRTVPVPGMMDMAKPAFEGVGIINELREAFWYRKTFTLPGPIPTLAQLKIHKAKFGQKVYLNGHLVGEHLPCFTPAYFDLTGHLKGNGADNELIVRIGANPDSLQDNIPWGYDFEKQKYLPGIYDSVELILSGTPHITNVQIAPDLTVGKIRVRTLVRNRSGRQRNMALNYRVSEKLSGKTIAVLAGSTLTIAAGREETIDVSIPVSNYRMWSPEYPFLYVLSVSSDADEMETTFGMRSFSFDRKTGFALLNGKPRYLKGSNTCFFRFMEDPDRGSLPWDEQWVRQLHRKVKSLGWDTLRYCIGFPPEFWYRIADEEGILIQDEYPFWYFDQCPGTFTSEQLAVEFTDWMHERVNHPCVVIWDACNESTSPITAPAIARVRDIDLSNRPWENSTNGPPQPTDCWESHPYVFDNPNFQINALATKTRFPESPHNAKQYTKPPNIIINEYPWLWIDRQGTACKLSEKLYLNLLGPDSTVQQRRKLYASYLAILTEYWRSYRQAAAVMHFCVLGYSRPGGFTSDNFIDLENLIFEPEFEKAAIRSFAPIAVMIENWEQEIVLLPNEPIRRDIPVIVSNDLENDWAGTLTLHLYEGDHLIRKQKKSCQVKGFGQQSLTFQMTYPSKLGNYKLIADLEGRDNVNTGLSIREFSIITAKQKAAMEGVAIEKAVSASSLENDDLIPAFAVDGDLNTRWSSKFEDPGWLTVDLGGDYQVNKVSILWDRACAKSYAIQVSEDGENWTDVYKTDSGKGGKEVVTFDPVLARQVRMYGTVRATQWGYSIYEFQVFGTDQTVSGNTIEAFTKLK